MPGRGVSREELTRQIAGVLHIPEGLLETRVPPAEPGPFERELLRAITEPIASEGEASALLPFLVPVPGAVRAQALWSELIDGG